VLDVAGGRGELSYLLHMQGVRVTCIDRRACNPCKALIRQETRGCLVRVFSSCSRSRLVPRHSESHPDDPGPRMMMGEDFDISVQKWVDMCAAAAAVDGSV
jgi:hypothetical protein